MPRIYLEALKAAYNRIQPRQQPAGARCCWF
jgi:hypothetical protein